MFFAFIHLFIHSLTVSLRVLTPRSSISLPSARQFLHSTSQQLFFSRNCFSYDSCSYCLQPPFPVFFPAGSMNGALCTLYHHLYRWWDAIASLYPVVPRFPLSLCPQSERLPFSFPTTSRLRHLLPIFFFFFYFLHYSWGFFLVLAPTLHK